MQNLGVELKSRARMCIGIGPYRTIELHELGSRCLAGPLLLDNVRAKEIARKCFVAVVFVTDVLLDNLSYPCCGI